MSFRSKALVILLVLGAGALLLHRAGLPAPASSAKPSPSSPPAPAPPPTPGESGMHATVPLLQGQTLAPLGSPPDWTSLEPFQDTITRADFERLLTTVFTTGDAWRSYIAINDTEAVITTGAAGTGLKFHLRFAGNPAGNPVPRHWRSGHELPPAPAGRPLEGLRIALDPGHIGGVWAKMEERCFSVGGAAPVCEGDLTLMVARLLKPRLESLGAIVSMVRNSSDPLTPLRPETLLAQAAEDGEAGADSRKLAERLFYRTAEIRARAELVNGTLKPDLVICLHFNADAWGDARHPTLVEHSHLHLLLNGGYADDEIRLSDQRFEMLRKLLDRTHAEEASVGADVAAALYSATGLPPYRYNPESKNARMVDGNPYLWARNLLANRLYDCPVIFMEPYVMNSKPDYARIQAGDYEGLREVNGKMQPSIFREYAEAVANGLKTHYTKVRPLPMAPATNPEH